MGGHVGFFRRLTPTNLSVCQSDIGGSDEALQAGWAADRAGMGRTGSYRPGLSETIAALLGTDRTRNKAERADQHGPFTAKLRVTNVNH